MLSWVSIVGERACSDLKPAGTARSGVEDLLVGDFFWQLCRITR